MGGVQSFYQVDLQAKFANGQILINRRLDLLCELLNLFKILESQYMG